MKNCSVCGEAHASTALKCPKCGHEPFIIRATKPGMIFSAIVLATLVYCQLGG
jgi:uncharacterized OB-fold protein